MVLSKFWKWWNFEIDNGQHRYQWPKKSPINFSMYFLNWEQSYGSIHAINKNNYNCITVGWIASSYFDLIGSIKSLDTIKSLHSFTTAWKYKNNLTNIIYGIWFLLQCRELRQDSFSAVVVLTIGGSASSIDDGCFPSLTHNYCFLHQPLTVIFLFITCICICILIFLMICYLFVFSYH